MTESKAISLVMKLTFWNLLYRDTEIASALGYDSYSKPTKTKKRFGRGKQRHWSQTPQ
jgi:hypothetical protein